MTRHGMNATARGDFTYAEKQKTGWGSQTRRFGKDSTKPFDHCTLCLHPVRDPMACTEGHLFCRECIYSNLLTQKEDMAEKTAAWEADQARREAEGEQRVAEAEEAKFRAFDRAERGITSQQASNSSARNSTALVVASRSSSSGSGGDQAPALESRKDREKREKNEREEIVASLTFKHDMRSDLQKQTDMRKTSFWIPECVPSAEVVVEKPLSITLCPLAAHPLRAKKLLRLKFTAELSASGTGSSADGGRDADADCAHAEKTDGRAAHEGRYQCPSCRKTLVAQRVTAMKKCGHVLCGSCVDEFVIPEGRCLVCGVGVRPGKDVLPLQQGGTGFAAHNTVETTKFAPSMR